MTVGGTVASGALTALLVVSTSTAADALAISPSIIAPEPGGPGSGGDAQCEGAWYGNYFYVKCS